MVTETDADSRSLLLRALRGEEVERTPVWAMRQAGRWDPQFRELRGTMGFYEFSENAELAARASLCPQRFGVDGIILFYDITTLSVAMGQRFELIPERGPVPPKPIRTMSDVRKLTAHPDVSSFRHVLDTLRLVRSELAGELPVLAFAGAPYTMATYQIGAGKDVAATRTFIREQPDVWSALLEVTTDATIDFLGALLEAGVGAYQLFDSWAGFLSANEYLEHAHCRHQRIFEQVGGTSILFVKDAPFLDTMVRSGCTAVSLGTTHDLRSALANHPDLAFQGNVDHELLVTGTPEEVRAATRACLEAGGGRRHVLNLDHGMDRRAKPENFAAFVEEARMS